MDHIRPLRLYDVGLMELEQMVMGWGYQRECAHAIWRSVYRQRITDLREMAAVEPSLRQKTAAELPLFLPPVLARQEAPDGETRKDLLEMEDGETVEVVLLRYRDRRSVCVSTQLGCACGCAFCATGQSGFVRQLSCGEIVAQVLHAQRELATVGESLSNIVLMGMGEPLLNYDNTVHAIRRLADPRGMGFVQRRITLSTVGIPDAIRRLAREDLRVRLAVSLHAATDALRNRLVPIGHRFPLEELFEAVREYAERTSRRLMVEWAMIDGVNDSVGQASDLVRRLEGLPAHVNLIRLNKTAGFSGRGSRPESIEAFTAVLDDAGVPHTVRQRRGGAIAAGCGQLRASARPTS